MYKEEVFRSYELAKFYIKRCNNLRMNIPVVFLPLFRYQLAILEKTIASGLTTTTWLSQNLVDYFDNVNRVLSDLEAFLKEAEDVKIARVEEVIAAMERYVLVLIPKKPLDPVDLYEMNVKHRIKIAKYVQTKSIAIERAVVEMINKFVNRVKISEFDESGKRRFQLPLEDQDEMNYRTEELKPLDKYDWIHFDKINNATSYPSTLAAHVKMCNYITYDVQPPMTIKINQNFQIIFRLPGLC